MNLLPDDVILEFRRLFEANDAYQFAIGDKLVDLVDEFAHVIKRSEILRQLSGATGADPSTLRDRETMARWFSPEVRAEYEVLSYSQLRACKSAGTQWREYAEYAVNNLPAPVAAIRSRIKHNGDMIPVWQARWERILELCELMVNDNAAPSEVRGVCERVWGSREFVVFD